MKRRLILIIFSSLLLYAFYDIYRASVPSTIEDFFLPGSQPGDSGSIENPGKCDNCHGDYHAEVEPDFNWKGSMMAQAARDPLYHAALAIANQDAPESGDLCIRCHSPKGWLEGRSEPTDGSALTVQDREGITCDFCHKLVKPTPLGVNPYPDDLVYTANTYPLDQAYLATLQEIPEISGNGMYIADKSSAKRGPFDDANPNHQFIYSPFHSSSDLCGTCHDVSNPAFSSIKDGSGNIIDYAPNSWGEAAPSFELSSLLHIERTYSEWSKSDYNSTTGVQSSAFGGNKEFVSSCQDCHMRDTTGYGCNKNPPLRQDLPIHDLTGANTFIPTTLNFLYPGEVDTLALNNGIQRARYMLRNASTMELTVTNQNANVKIYNETGHKLPSGYPEGRRMWINIKAWGANGEVYESGKYIDATADLIQDPDVKIYQVKPGISPGLAAVLALPAGPSFHFVLNDTIYLDNRIPPRGFSNLEFEEVQSAPVGYIYQDGQYWDNTSYDLPFNPIAVESKLFYQTVSKEYIEFLRDENNSNNSGQIMYDVWEAFGKSSPELMSSAQWGEPIIDNDKDGYIEAVDCDDENVLVHPNAEELRDCIDNNCNSWVDEDSVSQITFKWVGCGEGDFWKAYENWNFQELPGYGDQVQISNAEGSQTTSTVDSSFTIGGLLIEENTLLKISEENVVNILLDEYKNEASLIIKGTLQIDGELTIGNAFSKGIIIHSGASVIVNGNLEILDHSGAGIENNGQFIIAPTGNVTINYADQGGYDLSEGAILQVHGNLCLKY